MGYFTNGGGGGKKKEDGILRLVSCCQVASFVCSKWGGGGGSGEKKRSWESCTVNCYPSGPSWLLRISHFVSLDNIFFGHTVNPLLTKVSLLSQDDWILVKILYFNGGLIKQKVLKPKLEFQEGSS